MGKTRDGSGEENPIPSQVKLAPPHIGVVSSESCLPIPQIFPAGSGAGFGPSQVPCPQPVSSRSTACGGSPLQQQPRAGI